MKMKTEKQGKPTGGGKFNAIPADTYQGRCIGVVDMGLQAGYEGKAVSQIALVFEIYDVLDGDGMPRTVTTWGITKSTNPKANLYKFLSNWLPEGVSTYEYEDWDEKQGKEATLIGLEVDTSLIPGSPAMVTMGLNKKGKVVLASLTAPHKSMTMPEQVHDSYHFDLDEDSPSSFAAIPEWLAKRVNRTGQPPVQDVFEPKKDTIAQDVPF